MTKIPTASEITGRQFELMPAVPVRLIIELIALRDRVPWVEIAETFAACLAKETTPPNFSLTEMDQSKTICYLMEGETMASALANVAMTASWDGVRARGSTCLFSKHTSQANEPWEEIHAEVYPPIEAMMIDSYQLDEFLERHSGLGSVVSWLHGGGTGQSLGRRQSHESKMSSDETREKAVEANQSRFDREKDFCYSQAKRYWSINRRFKIGRVSGWVAEDLRLRGVDLKRVTKEKIHEWFQKADGVKLDIPSEARLPGRTPNKLTEKPPLD